MQIRKIAIVEDDVAIQQMYKMKLALEGYDVMVAEDGAAGLVLCETFRPDAVLLDISMPVMSGDEMLKKMRETEWGAPIHVIILTNSSKSEAPSSLRFLHVERYIVKAHHTPKQVMDVVREVLGDSKVSTV